MSANRLLTASEAAVLLRLSVWTVYAWARRVRLPCVCLGARVLFERQQLEAAIGRARQPPAAPAPAPGAGRDG
jgi:excisionase family DNA binding protein